MENQVQFPKIIIEKELRVVDSKHKRGRRIYHYGYLSFKIPREYIGKRVKVIVIPAEE